jgi:hypothetical protein
MSEDVKIIDGYRGPEDNEFFFRFDPWRAAGTRDLLTWIEESTDYTIIHIPEWQIKSSLKGNSDPVTYGIRIEK